MVTAPLVGGKTTPRRKPHGAERDIGSKVSAVRLHEWALIECCLFVPRTNYLPPAYHQRLSIELYDHVRHRHIHTHKTREID